MVRRTITAPDRTKKCKQQNNLIIWDGILDRRITRIRPKVELEGGQPKS